LILTLLGVLATAATLFVLQPVLRGRESSVRSETPVDPERLRLHERRDQLLLGLAELDFERDAGKLGIEEHEQTRSRLLAEAARVTARLDERDGNP